MGVIRKQGIQTTVLSYIGVVLGYINVVMLFPKFFAPEQFGLTRVLIAVVSVAAQFSLFGLTNVIIRYFPQFKNEERKGHNGLLGWALRWSIVGTVVMAIALLVLRPWVVEHYQQRSALFVEFYYLLLPFLAFEVLSQLFAHYTRALYHSVVNVFFREVFIRAFTLVLILAHHFGFIGFDLFMQMFIGQYALMAAGLGFYLMMVGQFHLKVNDSFFSTELKNELRNYRWFTMLSGVSSLFLMNIDVIMIGSMIGLGQTAFYSVAFYIVALLNIPRNALSNIAVPVISDAWKRNDRETIKSIYAKTANNQLLIGTLLFVGIWANEANLFELLPPEYSGGKWVLFFVGLARLIDVGFGVNGGIITTSEHYRFDTYSNIILLVVTVALNLVFIPLHGIMGAAIATAISLTAFNLSKYIFLKLKFGFGPFSWKWFAIIGVGAAAYAISLLLPAQTLWVDIVLRSTIITAVFIPLVLVLRLSDDAVAFLRTLRSRFLKA